MANKITDLKEYHKKYRTDNKERLLKLKKEEYPCAQCGKMIQHCNKGRHEMTKYCTSRKVKGPFPNDEEIANKELIDKLQVQVDKLEQLLAIKDEQ